MGLGECLGYPQFMQELVDQRQAIEHAFEKAQMDWNWAQETIKKFTGLRLTGHYRPPKAGETFLSKDGHPLETACD